MRIYINEEMDKECLLMCVFVQRTNSIKFNFGRSSVPGPAGD